MLVSLLVITFDLQFWENLMFLPLLLFKFPLLFGSEQKRAILILGPFYIPFEVILYVCLTIIYIVVVFNDALYVTGTCAFDGNEELVHVPCL